MASLVLFAIRQTVPRAIHARGSQIISNWNRGPRNLHFRSLYVAHSDAFAARRTRFASRYARSNAKFISRSLQVATRVAESYEGNIWYWLGVQGVADRSDRLFFSLRESLLLLFPVLLVYHYLLSLDFSYWFTSYCIVVLFWFCY